MSGSNCGKRHGRNNEEIQKFFMGGDLSGNDDDDDVGDHGGRCRFESEPV